MSNNRVKIKLVQLLIIIAGISAISFSSGKLFNYSLFTSEVKSYKGELPDELQFVNDITDDFSHIGHDTVTGKHIVYNSENEKEFYFILSDPQCSHIRGFGGNVPFALVVGEGDIIKNLILLDHYETQSWIDDLNKVDFFDTWNGLKLNEAYEKDVDAVSGATMTSEAVIRCMTVRIGDFLEADVAETKKKSKQNLWGILASIVVLVFAAVSFFLPKETRKIRPLLLIASIVVLGFWQVQFLSMAAFNNWIINGLNIAGNITIFIMLVLSIILPLVFNKPFYCQYVCPYGAAQELLWKVKILNLNISNKVLKVLAYVKYVLLIVIVIISVFSFNISLEDFEPFSAFQFKFASTTVLIIAITMLLFSLFKNKPWCRYFCPTGALLGMLRVKKNTNKS